MPRPEDEDHYISPRRPNVLPCSRTCRFAGAQDYWPTTQQVESLLSPRLRAYITGRSDGAPGPRPSSAPNARLRPYPDGPGPLPVRDHLRYPRWDQDHDQGYRTYPPMPHPRPRLYPGPSPYPPRPYVRPQPYPGPGPQQEWDPVGPLRRKIEKRLRALERSLPAVLERLQQAAALQVRLADSMVDMVEADRARAQEHVSAVRRQAREWLEVLDVRMLQAAHLVQLVAALQPSQPDDRLADALARLQEEAEARYRSLQKQLAHAAQLVVLVVAPPPPKPPPSSPSDSRVTEELARLQERVSAERAHAEARYRSLQEQTSQAHEHMQLAAQRAESMVAETEARVREQVSAERRQAAERYRLLQEQTSLAHEQMQRAAQRASQEQMAEERRQAEMRLQALQKKMSEEQESAKRRHEERLKALQEEMSQEQEEKLQALEQELKTLQDEMSKEQEERLEALHQEKSKEQEERLKALYKEKAKEQEERFRALQEELRALQVDKSKPEPQPPPTPQPQPEPHPPLSPGGSSQPGSPSQDPAEPEKDDEQTPPPSPTPPPPQPPPPQPPCEPPAPHRPQPHPPPPSKTQPSIYPGPHPRPPSHPPPPNYDPQPSSPEKPAEEPSICKHQEKKSQIFISFRVFEAKHQALALKEALEDRGLSAFCSSAPGDIQGGQDWVETISSKLGESRMFVALVGRSYGGKGTDVFATAQELSRAMRDQKDGKKLLYIIPLARREEWEVELTQVLLGNVQTGLPWDSDPDIAPPNLVTDIFKKAIDAGIPYEDTDEAKEELHRLRMQERYHQDLKKSKLERSHSKPFDEQASDPSQEEQDTTLEEEEEDLVKQYQVKRFQIFISFRVNEAKHQALALKEALEERGFSTFCSSAPGEIKEGDDWVHIISSKLGETRVFVALVGKSYGGEGTDVFATRQELATAIRHKRKGKKELYVVPLVRPEEWEEDAAQVLIGNVQMGLPWNSDPDIAPPDLVTAIFKKALEAGISPNDTDEAREEMRRLREQEQHVERLRREKKERGEELRRGKKEREEREREEEKPKQKERRPRPSFLSQEQALDRLRQTGQLRDLATVFDATANSGRVDQIIDLSGWEIMGEFSGDLLVPPQSTFCNGTVRLPEGAKVRCNSDCSLFNLTITGAGKRGYVVDVRGNVRMQGCSIEGGEVAAVSVAGCRGMLVASGSSFRSKCNGLQVLEGAAVELERGCRADGNGEIGVSVGVGGRLYAEGLSACGNGAYNAFFEAADVELGSCTFNGCKRGYGLFATGRTRIQCSSTTISDNAHGNLYASGGASVKLKDRCVLDGSLSKPGLCVYDQGTTVTCISSSISGNASDAVRASSKASVKLMDHCRCDGNKGFAFWTGFSATIAADASCTATGNGEGYVCYSKGGRFIASEH